MSPRRQTVVIKPTHLLITQVATSYVNNNVSNENDAQ